MPEEQDWVADTEGNLRPARDGEPPTDEFGRDDPESLERERRRRERQARRGKQPANRATTAEAPRPARPPEQSEAVAPPPAVDGRDGHDGTGAPPSRPRGKYRRRRLIALGLVLVGVLAAWFLVALFQPPPFDPGDGNGEQEIVTVPAGATASDVADLLTAHGVVSNGTLFQWRLKLAGEDGKILPGRYVLAQDMSYGAAIDKLTSSGGQVTVTIPEGEDRTQIAATVKDLGLNGDYLAASKSVKGFDPNRYGAQNPKSLEGFLFPATYQLDPGADVDQLVSEQLQAFRENIAGVSMSYAKSKNLTVYDVLIIASMIDKEVMVPSERPLVAAVIYNRLHRGMPLGIDATTRYEFHNYTGAITESQLHSPSPYNTRNHAGLTPTPIGNPGLAAIRAAARPAKVDYLYYVLKANGNGQHCFTASGAEFNQLVAAYNAGQAAPNCRS